jgi:alpha-beta hydrolase superfamily lysophospholipase
MNRASDPVEPAIQPGRVVLVHGLWMPSAVMAPLAFRLARAGYATCVFDFRGRAPFEANRIRLAAYLREQTAPFGVVAHSLGGVLTLAALNGDPAIPVTRAVLLGSPVRGSLSGRRLAAWRAGRWLLGGAEAWWAIRTDAVWRRQAPLGTISGTAARGLGRLLGTLPEANDGVVATAETAVDGAREAISLPVGHSGLLFSSAVARNVIRFLGNGSFREA